LRALRTSLLFNLTGIPRFSVRWGLIFRFIEAAPQ
jgi:hypothetical protein